jgi:hypothetical protein
LIHSPVDGHLGSFCSLAVMSAVLNMGVQVSLLHVTYTLAICPRVVQQDRRVILFLVFSGASILISVVAALIDIPLTAYEGPLQKEIILN